MSLCKLQDLPIAGKKVLMRVDFNVPLNPDGTIADDTRIVRSLTSIQYVLKQNARLILMSHLGRPKGKDPKHSLAPCAARLSSLLHLPVHMAPDCIGKETEQMAQKLLPKEVLLLENLRFHPAEEKPSLDPSFAKQLSSLADFYVDDAFGAVHRAHSSISEIAHYFPEKKGAGFLLQEEISFLEKLIHNPKQPFYAVIGGSKISSKLPILKSLLERVSALFIGGAMAHTFLKALNVHIGDSLCEEDQLEEARLFIALCQQKNIPLYLPEDLVIAEEISASAKTQIVSKGMASPWKGVDIGPKTVEKWCALFEKAQTLFWNGPLGIAEYPPFAQGTYAIAHAIANLKNVLTIVGGGDSLAVIAKLHLEKKFSHLSTGGGASLEYLENLGHLPGIDVLRDLVK